MNSIECYCKSSRNNPKAQLNGVYVRVSGIIPAGRTSNTTTRMTCVRSRCMFRSTEKFGRSLRIRGHVLKTSPVEYDGRFSIFDDKVVVP